MSRLMPLRRAAYAAALLLSACLAVTAALPRVAAAAGFTITVTQSGNGSVKPGTTTVAAGATQAFTIQPAACWTLVDVVVDGVSAGPVTTYVFANVQAPHTLAVTFVAPPASTTSMTAAPATGSCSRPSTLRAVVTNATGGSVRWYDGLTLLGDGFVDVTGVATLVVNPLAVGSHSLVAKYDGGACSVPSQSAPQAYVVQQPATALDLTASATIVRGLVPVDLAAAVRDGAGVVPTAGGSVTFRDGATTIGAVAPALGVAARSQLFTTPGTHSISASYGGDGCLVAVNAAPVAITVEQATGSIELTTSAEPAGYAAPLAFTATLLADGGPATWASGSVTFTVDGVDHGPVGVAAGVAVLAAPVLDLGAHTVTAHYLGSTFLSAASATITQTVVPGAATLSLTSAANPVRGYDAALTATVSPATATGTITFSDGDGVFATAAVSGGVATATYHAALFGTYTLTADYSGDSRSLPASDALAQRFIGLATTTTVTSASNPGAGGTPVAITAHVSPPAATGTVEFRDEIGPFGSATLAGGVATAAYTLPQSGTHTITATYRGDATYDGSSGTLAQGVIARVPTSIALSTTRNPARVGDAVTFTAVLSPAAATGSIVFQQDAGVIGTVPLSGGVATLVYTLPATPGRYTISASYAGNATYLPFAKSFAQDVVTELPTALAITSSANPSPLLSVTITVKTTPATATGSITLSADDGFVDVKPLVWGVAAFGYTAQTFGTRALTAAYSGDGTNAPATSTFVQSFSGAASATSLVALTNPVLVLQPDTLRATVTPASATGTVAFRDGGVTLGTAALAGGVARLVASFATAGTHALTAAYSGDATYGASSGATALVVDGLPSTTVLTQDRPTSGTGEWVQFTATVGAAASGTARVDVDDVTVATVGLVAGRASWETMALAPGMHVVRVTCTPASLYAPSSASVVHWVVDYLPGVLRVEWPNTQERLLIGSTLLVRWNAASAGSVPAVSVWLSRVDAPPQWELLADGVPNTGEFAWTVTGPSTSLARFAVIDQSGTVGSDASDLPSLLADLATPTVVTRLAAEAEDAGIRVRWAVDAAADVAQVDVERAGAVAGPWAGVDAERASANGESTALDRSVEAGQPYWYRLVTTTSTGGRYVFGPVGAVAGVPAEFALGAAAPNPARHGFALGFAVARTAPVRLALLDVQGRTVAVLADGTFRPGRYRAAWDGRGDHGAVPAGVYFLQFRTPGRTFTGRVAVVR